MFSRNLFLSIFALASAGTAAASGRHLSLVKSEPANSAIVKRAPKAITLWFTQKPNVKLTRVVLVYAGRDTVKTVAAVAADTTGKKVRISITPTLRPGKYEVSWRTLARDGHAVAGKFAFTYDTSAKVATSASAPRKPR